MAKFIFEFEDRNDGGVDCRIELEGFSDASSENMENQTNAQNLYFALNLLISKKLGLEIPEVNKD